MAKYRKKPVVIDAKQVRLVCSDGEVEFTDGTSEVFPMDHEGVYVVTIHGQRTRFTDGDWLAYEADGLHRYPIKPDSFAATYEEVDHGDCTCPECWGPPR